MQIRALMGRPRSFQELVVPPRPRASSPSAFAVAALGTVTVLSGAVIGVSQLGVALDSSGHIGGRIMAVPQTTSTSPFSWFGAKAPLPITIPPEDTSSGAPSLNAAGGDTTDQSNGGYVVTAAAVPARTRAGVRNQGVAAVSAVLKVPSAPAAARLVMRVVSAAVPALTQAGVRNQGVTAVSAVLKVPSAPAAARPVVTVVSAASAYPSAIVALFPAHTPPAVVVPDTSHERADGSSEREARHHPDKARKHKLSHAKAAKESRSD